MFVKFLAIFTVLLFAASNSAFYYEYVYVPSYTAYAYPSNLNYYLQPYYGITYSIPSMETYYYAYTPTYYSQSYAIYPTPTTSYNTYNTYNYYGSSNFDAPYGCKISYVGGIAYRDC